MMLLLPQNEACKRATLLIVPGESCGLQTPAILTARLLFHGCGDKSRRSCVPDQGGLGSMAERSITFYIVLIMSDVSVGGGGPCMHSSQAMWYKGRGHCGGVLPGDRRLH